VRQVDLQRILVARAMTRSAAAHAKRSPGARSAHPRVRISVRWASTRRGSVDLSREHLDEMLDGMMTADDVAEVVVFVLERPRHLRLLETALRPVTEASAG